MKHYEYVNVLVSQKWTGGKLEEHRTVIDEYAAMGYRYVGYIPTEFSDYGKYKAVDLIFERAD